MSRINGCFQEMREISKVEVRGNRRSDNTSVPTEKGVGGKEMSVDKSY